MWFFWQGGCFFLLLFFVCLFFNLQKEKTLKQANQNISLWFVSKQDAFKKMEWCSIYYFFFSTALRKHVTNLENNMKKFIVGGRQHSFKLRYAGLVSLFVCFPFSVSRLFFGYFRSVSNLFVCLHCRIGSKMKNQLFPDLCLANSLSLSVPRGVQKLL